MKQYKKKGAGLLGSVKATVTSMSKTCKEIWLNYSTSLQSLIDEIDVFYRDTNMENILLTLYKTDYTKSQILNEFEMIKIKINSLSDVMSGKTKSYYDDPDGKLCSGFIYSNFDGKKDAMTFDRYLQGLQKKLLNIRDVMKTVNISQTQSVPTNIDANVSEAKTNASNINNTNIKKSNTNTVKKGWLSSAKDKLSSAMPKTCEQLWDAQKNELFALIDEIDKFWVENNMAVLLKKKIYVDVKIWDKLYLLSLFDMIKNRISKIQNGMTHEELKIQKQNRVVCLYFIPEPDLYDYSSFDSYLKDLKQGLLQIADIIKTLDMSIFQNSSNVPVQSAGKKKTYIKMKGTHKQYLVHKDNTNNKFIKQQGNNVYLSDIRGKYLYMQKI